MGLLPAADSRVAIIPAPIENTTNFQFGTAKAPQAVLAASQHIDLFDFEFEKEFSEIGILTYTAKDYRGLKGEAALNILQNEIERALEENLFPVTVGGESSISIPAVRALSKGFDSLSMLRFDSRPKLKNGFEGNPFSHLCSSRRILDLGIKPVLLGVRSYSKEEWDFSKAQEIRIIQDVDSKSTEKVMNLLSSELKEKVYISISADAFDPSEVPGSSHQEPHGLSWEPTVDLLKQIFENHDVVGVDFCDLRPMQNSAQSEIFFAKLMAKVLAMKFF